MQNNIAVLIKLQIVLENFSGRSMSDSYENALYRQIACTAILKFNGKRINGIAVTFNLINHGIIPMLFEDPAAYDSIELGDELEICGLLDQIPTRRVTVRNKTRGTEFAVVLDLSDAELEVVLAGGQLRLLNARLAAE